MTVYTYWANKLPDDGTLILNVTSGPIEMGTWGDFTNEEYYILSKNYVLLPGEVGPGIPQWISPDSFPNLAEDSWKGFVSTESDLPVVGNEDGDVRLTLDTVTIYVWENGQWLPAAGGAPTSQVFQTLRLANGCQYMLPPGGIASPNNTCNCVTHDAAGNILMGGEVLVAGTAMLFVARCLPGGATNTYPGELDPAFGNGGWWTWTPTNGTAQIVQGITVDSTGRIYIAGGVISGGLQQACVVRILANGQTDASFGVNGAAIFLPNSTNDALAFGVAIDSNGDVLVGGSATVISSGLAQAFCTRLTSGGVVDNTYGTSGSTVPVISDDGHGAAWGIEVDALNRAHLGCAAWNDTVATTTVANNAGAGTITVPSVTGFRHGAQITIAGGGNSEVHSITIPPSGTTLTINGTLAHTYPIGSTVTEVDQMFGVVRLTSAGALDTTFNGTGINVQTFGVTSDGLAIRLDAQGRAIVSGGGEAYDPNFDLVMFAARYRLTGVLDPNYGAGGTIENVPAGVAVINGTGCNGMDIDSAQNTVYASLGGYATAARLLPNGVLDPSFGVCGVTPKPGLTQDVGTDWMVPNGVCVLPTGLIALAGVGSGAISGSNEPALVILSANGRVLNGLSSSAQIIPPSWPVLPANGQVTNPIPPIAGISAGSPLHSIGAITGDGATTQFVIRHGLGFLKPAVRAWLAQGSGGNATPTNEVKIPCCPSPNNPLTDMVFTFPFAPAAGESYYVEFRS